MNFVKWICLVGVLLATLWAVPTRPAQRRGQITNKFSDSRSILQKWAASTTVSLWHIMRGFINHRTLVFAGPRLVKSWDQSQATCQGLVDESRVNLAPKEPPDHDSQTSPYLSATPAR